MLEYLISDIVPPSGYALLGGTINYSGLPLKMEEKKSCENLDLSGIITFRKSI